MAVRAVVLFACALATIASCDAFGYAYHGGHTVSAGRSCTCPRSRPCGHLGGANPLCYGYQIPSTKFCYQGTTDCTKYNAQHKPRPRPRATRRPTNTTRKPTPKPTLKPTKKPTLKPTKKPTLKPTNKPTDKPTDKPTAELTWAPTAPTGVPTVPPTGKPTGKPTQAATPDPRIKVECLKACSNIFGKIDSSETVFIIDTSGSMSAKFQVDGKDYNRLTYVIKSLGDILDTLQPTQKYLIMKYSSQVEIRLHTFNLATAANIAASKTRIAKWETGGTTCTWNALQAGRQAIIDSKHTKGAEMFLLTDGIPNIGTVKILEGVQFQWKDFKPPVHTIAFLKGGREDTALRESASKFMVDLANATKGVAATFESANQVDAGKEDAKHVARIQKCKLTCDAPAASGH